MPGEKITFESIKELSDLLNQSKVERNGYIMLPSIEGFKMYEISEKRLNLYLRLEQQFRKDKDLF